MCLEAMTETEGKDKDRYKDIDKDKDKDKEIDKDWDKDRDKQLRTEDQYLAIYFSVFVVPVLACDEDKDSLC